MRRQFNTIRVMAALLALVVMLACSDDSTSPEVGDRITDAFPLELGNSWEYTLLQSIFVQEDTTLPPISLSATGFQRVEISRTENIGGLEAYGMRTYHQIDYMFSTGADTVVERRYFAPAPNGEVLLRADQPVYNPTGGFIPFVSNRNQPRLGTTITVDGREEFISFETLSYILSNPRGRLYAESSGGTLLASDGVQNDDEAILYGDDYVYLFNELYTGLNWVSLAAQGVGGINISNRVTNMLSSLDGFDGPIAEVEQTNALINALASEQYRQRFYYKGGVGLVRAEISDPEFIIIAQYPDSTVFLGTGTWEFTKTLTSYDIK